MHRRRGGHRLWPREHGRGRRGRPRSGLLDHGDLYLRDLIIAGRAEPSFVVSKELPLADALDAYQRFYNREEGYSKVLLHPYAA